MQFTGERFVPKPAGQIWTKLRDMSYLVQCIPEATVEGTPSEAEAQCQVRPNLGFVKGAIDVTLRYLGGQEPTNIRYQLLSKGVGSSSEVETTLTLTEQDGGTRIAHVTDVKKLGGLLKMVPSGLIKGAAQKAIDDVWASIEAHLTSS